MQLEAIKFRYSTEKIVEETAEPVEEETPAQAEQPEAKHGRNHRRRRPKQPGEGGSQQENG